MSSIENYIEKDYLKEIKKISEPYLKVKLLVYTLFKDKVNNNNEKCINHLIRVSNKMKTSNGKLAGLLHEINLYFDIDFDDLIELNIPEEVINSIKYLKNEDEADLEGIILNKDKLALELIIEDTLDNSMMMGIKKRNEKEQEGKNMIKKLVLFGNNN